jgi:Ni/Co efflux regulator RcnB
MKKLSLALLVTGCLTVPVLAAPPAADKSMQLAQLDVRIGDRDREGRRHREHDRDWDRERRHREHDRYWVRHRSCKTVIIKSHGEVRKIRRCRGD